jgi:glucose-1-phosphate cytidylyltransferase
MTPPVVILCGGRGTRLQERTHAIPKPLVEIGPHPIVWHVVQLYAVQGFEEFVLCTGYMAEQIEAFAAEAEWPDGIDVKCVDTGLDTPTGGRIAKVRDVVGERRFCATYSDGVADVDLRRTLAFHEEHGALATMTVVRPELQFGVTQMDDDGLVTGFTEKPRAEHWINGGFFVFEPGVFGYLADDSTLEREPLEGLAGDGQLRAFRHTGFWDCMDTYKDSVMLNDLWNSGDAPWKLWDSPGPGGPGFPSERRPDGGKG